MFHQFQFSGNGVNGVHDVIILGEVELRGSVWRIEGLIGIDHHCRVDFQNALLRDVNLIVSHRLSCGENLAVQIGEAHTIVINQVQRTDPAARQRFHRIPAHPSDAEHGNAGMEEFFYRTFSQK